MPDDQREKYTNLLHEAGKGWKRRDILTSEMVGEIWHFDSKAEYYTTPFTSGRGLPMISDTARRVL